MSRKSAHKGPGKDRPPRDGGQLSRSAQCEASASISFTRWAIAAASAGTSGKNRFAHTPVTPACEHRYGPTAHAILACSSSSRIARKSRMMDMIEPGPRLPRT